MNPKRLEQVAALREKGMLRFVLTKGVLSWGLPMFVVMTFIVNRVRPEARFICVSLLVWTLAGAVFGMLLWIFKERRLRNEGR
jgi:hypothetical protein